jgi:hypothetical protein
MTTPHSLPAAGERTRFGTSERRCCSSTSELALRSVTVSESAAARDLRQESASKLPLRDNRGVSDRAVIQRLITGVARSVLRPMGLSQKGRSRLWYDDRGWSLTVVEFQPGRSPGTYLNVGAMWLWADRSAWTFDHGYRTYWRDDATFTWEPPYGEAGWQQHVDFLDVDQFSREMALVARVAALQVEKLRQQFPDVAAVGEQLSSMPTQIGESPLWRAFHCGAAAALSGDLPAAKQNLEKVASADLRVGWEQDLAAKAVGLLRLVHDPVALRDRLVEATARGRRLLGLPAVTDTDASQRTRPREQE